jgi:hypothetical protein
MKYKPKRIVTGGLRSYGVRNARSCPKSDTGPADI